MGDALKKDPILKTVLVVFLGLIVFSFLFGFNFGGTGYDASASQASQHASHHGGMGAGAAGGPGYMTGIIPGLIQFLIQILMVLLVFALIAGIVIGVKNFVAKQDSEALKKYPVIEYINQDPVLKVLVIAIAGIFGLYLVTGLLSGIGFGSGYNVSPQFMILNLINFLVKLLMIAFVAFGSLALWQYFKNQAPAQPPKQEIIQLEASRPAHKAGNEPE
ncbi:hypothetical protein [Sporomusa acidovorans]|uniref:hypothetical protein n=1 Tax=Sporomusa acidovorans TaxID=112900 RepID=UPI0008836ECF|nr:hypothetical protein [Sporomusa acidovorans]OZC19074.1 hypothetical protein SPACI_31600 [Sporomusa acidovorans DSM 3132]SDD66392.1 hypothetical protein SAMN04488499_100320 [Sporomusa acidovorans]